MLAGFLDSYDIYYPTLPNAGHRALYQQPEAFGRVTTRVLTETR